MSGNDPFNVGPNVFSHGRLAYQFCKKNMPPFLTHLRAHRGIRPLVGPQLISLAGPVLILLKPFILHQQADPAFSKQPMGLQTTRAGVPRTREHMSSPLHPV